MTLGSLYIEAQGCVPVLLENLCGMSFSGACWPLGCNRLLGGAWFQCRYGAPWVVLGFSVGMEVFDGLLSINVPWSQEFFGILRIWT